MFKVDLMADSSSEEPELSFKSAIFFSVRRFSFLTLMETVPVDPEASSMQMGWDWLGHAAGAHKRKGGAGRSQGRPKYCGAGRAEWKKPSYLIFCSTTKPLR